ncbi:MAG: 30S ribosomal protein S17 [Candidatus Altiarchaeota archaeon]|nr:30S ribosomal protein S17 [Candidatus Altiarchaeota archaeon]
MAKVKKIKKEKTNECSDKNCPIHGSLATRGIVLEGVVASDKMDKTVIVQRSRHVKLRKYERYRPVKSRIPAHNPPCINAVVGDKVRIAECRKLSKTVSFVVTEKLS